MQIWRFCVPVNQPEQRTALAVRGVCIPGKVIRRHQPPGDELGQVEAWTAQEIPGPGRSWVHGSAML
jgi:hypothetical protein